MATRIDIFEAMPVPKAVASLAVPTILSQLVTLIYNLADIFYVGQIGDPNKVAAVSIGYPAFMLLTVLGNLYGIGGGSLIARLLGARKPEDAKKAASFSFWSCAVSALLLGAAVQFFMTPLLSLLGASDATMGFGRDYLFWTVVMGAVPTSVTLTMGHLMRGEGAAKKASVGIMLGGILNIILDPVFIFQFRMGVAGAALATMLSNCAGMAYFLVVMSRGRGRSVLSVSPKDIRLDPEILKPIFAVGLPAALYLLLAVVSNGTIYNMASAYGDIAVAAFGIVKKVDMIPLNVCRGLSQGILPLIAYNYASKNFDRMEAVNRFARVAAGCFAFLCIAVFELFAPAIIWIFIRNDETISLGTQFLRIACLATPFMGMNALMNTTFQAMGKGGASLLLTVCRQGLVNIPLLFLMRAVFGLYGIIWTQLVSDLITLFIGLFLYRGVLRQLRREEAAACDRPLQVPVP